MKTKKTIPLADFLALLDRGKEFACGEALAINALVKAFSSRAIHQGAQKAKFQLLNYLVEMEKAMMKNAGTFHFYLVRLAKAGPSFPEKTTVTVEVEWLEFVENLISRQPKPSEQFAACIENFECAVEFGNLAPFGRELRKISRALDEGEHSKQISFDRNKDGDLIAASVIKTRTGSRLNARSGSGSIVFTETPQGGIQVSIADHKEGLSLVPSNGRHRAFNGHVKAV